MSKVIYRTYRPSTFSAVTGQSHVVTTLQNQYAAESLAHAYLFTGPRGVGKTTVARLVAKLVNCLDSKKNEPCNTCASCEAVGSGKALDVFEIDAASHTDVEHVRENIIQAVRFAPSFLKKKVYIIDEVHMLSGSAFNALLKTLEEPPEHALFILATTELHKVPETIVSRCQRFDFRKISASELVERMRGIVKQENVKVDEDVLQAIAKHSGGCARDAESLLGQVLALGEDHVGMDEASLVLPATSQVLVEEFASALKAHDAQKAIQLLNTYLDQGVDLRQFLADTTSWLRDQLLKALANKTSTDDLAQLQRSIEELLKAEHHIRSEQIPQLPVELAIIRICAAPTSTQKDFPEQGVGSESVIASEAKQSLNRKIARPDNSPVGRASLVEDELPPRNDIHSEIALSMVEPNARNDEEGKTVFDSIPIISLDDVKSKWPEVYEQIKSCNASLPLFMNDCEVCGVQGDHVELGFAYDLYVQTVNQDKNRRTIEEVFEKVLGKRLRVRAIQSKKAPEDAVQNLLTEFGGSLV
jgi:DNA polymerase-3 subunit gamma/tau